MDVRPTLLVVEHYAEYLQSEAKEINLRVGLKAYGAGTAGAITLKSLNSDAVAQPNFASSVTSQAAQQPSPASSGRLIKVGCKAQRGMACTSLANIGKAPGSMQDHIEMATDGVVPDGSVGMRKQLSEFVTGKILL